MNEDTMAELIGLSVGDELPQMLRAQVEEYLASHPEAARDAAMLRATVARLKAAPAERPDPWFVERLLDALLREHAAAQSPTGTKQTRK